MHFLADYGLFLAKSLTLVFSILFLAGGILVLANRGKDKSKEKLDIKKINDKYEEMAHALNAEILDKDKFKKYLKEQKKAHKEQESQERKRIFVLNFHGDIKATEVESLREEITGILMVAKPTDEVIVRLESSGGLVSAYGLAASQLLRIKDKQIPLTIAVDEVAASGGYLMACVADRLLTAPFAIIGSIGVLAQIPNFHRLLKKHEIDFEQITSGEFKRTLSLFGENTEKGRKKLQEEIEQIHGFFKEFIAKNRPKLNVPLIATGETWLGTKALELGLIDQLMTSDDYLMHAANEKADIYEVTYSYKMSFADKVVSLFQTSLRKIHWIWREESQQTRVW